MAKIKVKQEKKTGRNTKFELEMSRAELVSQIKKGLHPDYYVRKINGIDTPVSKPNKNKDDNLG